MIKFCKIEYYSTRSSEVKLKVDILFYVVEIKLKSAKKQLKCQT